MDDAAEEAPVTFVTVNGASETLHHKISVANIWPWHVTMQQTAGSRAVAAFAGAVQRSSVQLIT